MKQPITSKSVVPMTNSWFNWSCLDFYQKISVSKPKIMLFYWKLYMRAKPKESPPQGNSSKNSKSLRVLSRINFNRPILQRAF